MADWDERYRRGEKASLEPNPLVPRAIRGLEPGDALDLACGAGRHALYLAEQGWRVTAVDASPVGIELVQTRARERGREIRTVIADLELDQFPLAPDSYDLICDLYYLQRDLFADIRQALRVGGTLVAAIHLAPDDSEGASASHSYVLNEGELRRYFQDWDILHYHETTGTDLDAGEHHLRTAELIARRPQK